MRQKYQYRFIFRILILAVTAGLYFWKPDHFRILKPGHFLERLSWLHLIWIVWMGDMVMKLIPDRNALALGAAKQSKACYEPADTPFSAEKLTVYTKKNNRRALLIFIVWCCLGAAIGVLRRTGILGNSELFLLSVLFYVLDLYFVLYKCPFQTLFLHNRCCTTCRIFNWDHFMMVTPIIWIRGFYSLSLMAAAVFILLIWEYRVHRYPERFFEGSNKALKCENCTDYLCGKKHGT